MYKNVAINKEGCIGNGSYGSVWKGKLLDSQTPCAVKIPPSRQPFHQFLGEDNCSSYRKFKGECEFLKSLKHPNIVSYLATVTDSRTGAPVLVMELMDENLSEYLRRVRPSPLPLEKVLPLATQVKICGDIVSALAYLHSLQPNRAVHRDLSSNNILLNDECAKVSDFGISKFIDQDKSTKSLSSSGRGTGGYIPPESWTTSTNYDEKWDIFQFGVLMVQVVTCLPPAPKDRYDMDDNFQYVPEIIRRADHIEIMESLVLRELARSCLIDKPKDRPSASQVYALLQKEFQPYMHMSLQQTWCCIMCNVCVQDKPDFSKFGDGVLCATCCELIRCTF